MYYYVIIPFHPQYLPRHAPLILQSGGSRGGGSRWGITPKFSLLTQTHRQTEFYNIRFHPLLDILECDATPCHTHANCTDTDGSYLCECHIGYTGDGYNCSGKLNVAALFVFSLIREITSSVFVRLKGYYQRFEFELNE